MGLTLLVTVGAIRHVISTDPNRAKWMHFTGIALFIILGIASYFFVRSGANLFIVPLFSYLAIQQLIYLIHQKNEALRHFLSAILPVILFIPLLYLFYIAFSLSNPFISVVLFSLLIFLIAPVFESINRAWIWLFLAMLVMGMIRAHGASKIHTKQPYQAQMYHHTDQLLGESLLISRDDKIDFLEQKFMQDPEMRQIHPLDNRKKLSSKTDIKFNNPQKIKIQRDTINDIEKINVSIQADAEVIACKIRTSDIHEIGLNNKVISSEEMLYAEYIGNIQQDSLQVKWEQKLGEKSTLFISTVEGGLIEKIDQTGFIIPGPTNLGGAIIHTSTLKL